MKNKTVNMSDIIKGQAIFNCGTVGHVSHGKSTLVYALTGTKTQRFKKEQDKNITIRLGYANCKLYLNKTTQKVVAFPSIKSDPVFDPESGEQLIHLSTISFVDCPGHELYMATMVSGSKIMDYAMVVIAANEQIPRPQTHQHLIALDYSHIEDISFVLNKLDLVKKKDVPIIKDNLDTYLTHMGMNDKSIHAISAATSTNIDELCMFLASKVYNRIPKTIQNANRPLRMNIVRSYNVNRPNTPLKDLVGAVVGGTIESGVLTVGDQVEIRPGIIHVSKGRKVIQPLVAKVLSLESDHNQLGFAIPGGLVGVNLSIYAGLSNDDRLKGCVLGHVGTLPDMYDSVSGKFRILDTRVPNDTDTELPKFHCNMKVDLVVNGISSVPAEIINIKTKKSDTRKGTLELKLKAPVVLNLKDDTNSIAIMIDQILVASLSVKDGTMSLPIEYPDDTDMEWEPITYNIQDDLTPYTHNPPSFNNMIDNIQFRKKRICRESYAYPDVTKINKMTYIHGNDFKTLVNSMTYTADATRDNLDKSKMIDIGTLLVENIGREFHQSKPRFNGEGNLAMNGVFLKDKVVKLVDKFVHKLLTCPSCRGNRVTLLKMDNTIRRHCHNCPSVTCLHTTDIGQIAN